MALRRDDTSERETEPIPEAEKTAEGQESGSGET